MPSGPEWIIVLVVVLVIFGGSQLPKLARNLGKAQKEFKDGLAEGSADKNPEAEAASRKDAASPTTPAPSSPAETD
jgi:sec-independent protein translocase protein TatA